MLNKGVRDVGIPLFDSANDTTGNSIAFTGDFAAKVGHVLVVDWVFIVNSSATPVTVAFRDGTGGATLFTLAVPANSAIAHPINGAKKTSVNTALAFDSSAGVTTLSFEVAGRAVQV